MPNFLFAGDSRELSHTSAGSSAGQQQLQGDRQRDDHGPKQKCTIAQLDRMRDSMKKKISQSVRPSVEVVGGQRRRIKAIDIYIFGERESAQEEE